MIVQELPIAEKELLETLGISRSLVRKLRNERLIPYIQIGGRILYILSKVIAAFEVKNSAAEVQVKDNNYVSNSVRLSDKEIETIKKCIDLKPLITESDNKN